MPHKIDMFNCRSNHPLAEQLTGWKKAEAIGRPVDEIFHIINQETRQPSIMPIKETLAHGTIHGLANDTILIARDGSECAIADSFAPIRDLDGQVVGAVLVSDAVKAGYSMIPKIARGEFGQVSASLQCIPRYVEVPPNIEDKRIMSTFSAPLFYLDN